MQDLTRRGILAAAALLPVSAAGQARAESLAGIEALQPDTAALPAITWQDADGHDHTLAESAGRPALINLWATWCVPCVAEMPALNRLAQALPGLAILPLSSDRLGAAAVAKFYAANGIGNLSILLDPKGTAERALGARGIPTSIIVADDGTVLGRMEGGVGWDRPDVVAWLKAHAWRKGQA